MIRKLLISAVAACTFYFTNGQQLTTPQASPTTNVKQNFALSSIELSYSRPGIKGRKIFGDLVPYGKVWRTGANSATTLTFGEDVTIGGTKIAAGKYGLLTIPEATEWTVIITKQTDVTSADAYKQDQDVVRVKAKVTELPFSVETFTMNFDDVKSNSCNLSMYWDKTYVNLPITVDVDSKVMKQIGDLMNNDNRPYYQAAQYYFDNGKDMNIALGWINKAVQESPNEQPWVHTLKTRILAKMGKKEEAKTAAANAIRVATATKFPDFVKQNEDILRSLK